MEGTNKIKKYLNQEMNDSQQSAFETELESDLELRKELKTEANQLKEDFLDWLSEESLRKQISQIDEALELVV